jgi:hypothetical protein
MHICLHLALRARRIRASLRSSVDARPKAASVSLVDSPCLFPTAASFHTTALNSGDSQPDELWDAMLAWDTGDVGFFWKMMLYLRMIRMQDENGSMESKHKLAAGLRGDLGICRRAWVELQYNASDWYSDVSADDVRAIGGVGDEHIRAAVRLAKGESLILQEDLKASDPVTSHKSDLWKRGRVAGFKVVYEALRTRAQNSRAPKDADKVLLQIGSAAMMSVMPESLRVYDDTYRADTRSKSVFVSNERVSGVYIPFTDVVFVMNHDESGYVLPKLNEQDLENDSEPILEPIRLMWNVLGASLSPATIRDMVNRASEDFVKFFDCIHIIPAEAAKTAKVLSVSEVTDGAKRVCGEMWEVSVRECMFRLFKAGIVKGNVLGSNSCLFDAMDRIHRYPIGTEFKINFDEPMPLRGLWLLTSNGEPLPDQASDQITGQFYLTPAGSSFVEISIRDFTRKLLHASAVSTKETVSYTGSIGEWYAGYEESVKAGMSYAVNIDSA